MFRLAFLMFSVWAFSAHADLYRWVDPATGSVKFSSYPPPWYGDEEAQKRAPKVEHIPARSAPRVRTESGPDAPRDAGPSLDSLERQRKAMLAQIASAAAARPGAGARPDTQKQLESLAAVMEQLDKLNPDGAAARRAEAEALLQKLINREQK
jgi:hypothetical protein